MRSGKWRSVCQQYSRFSGFIYFFAVIWHDAAMHVRLGYLGTVLAACLLALVSLPLFAHAQMYGYSNPYTAYQQYVPMQYYGQSYYNQYMPIVNVQANPYINNLYLPMMNQYQSQSQYQSQGQYYVPRQRSYSQPPYGGGYPNNYSYPTGSTDAFGYSLCNWQDYGISRCDFNPHQWVYDPYTGTWY